MKNSTLASEYVTDTMALVLHLENRRSSKTVNLIFEAADRGELTIYGPAIVIAEILYLSEKKRITLDLTQLEHHFAGHKTYQEIPLSFDIVQTASSLADIPELHDRLIAATARFSDIELVTNDPKIEGSKYVRTVW